MVNSLSDAERRALRDAQGRLRAVFEDGIDDPQSVADAMFGKSAKGSSRNLADTVARLSLATGEDGTAILRRAVGLMSAAVEHASKGGEVVFRDKSGRERRYKVPLREVKL